MISIITPAYNASRYLSCAIESVQAQTFDKWEMLIVDDYSRDNTLEIARSYAKRDHRIKAIGLKENMGAAQARNMALRQAQGPYIAFLDSDDMWLPQKLEKQLAFMKKGNHAFTFTSYECVSSDLSEVLYTVNAPAHIGYRGYLRNTIIGTLTVLINRDITGYFEMPLIRSSHDMALWLQLMRRGHRAFALQEVLAKYRNTEKSNTDSKWKAAKDVWKVYRNIEQLNLIYAGVNFIGYATNAGLKRLKR